MPFIAKSKSTKERIDITCLKNPRMEIDKDDCICQLCEKPLYVKAGFIVSAHFAHYPGGCDSDYERKAESEEHRLAKRKIAFLFRNKYQDSDVMVELEKPLPEIKRIADVLITFPGGWQIAHEIQLSSITIENLLERTTDYSKLGIDVIWWLGKAADKETNRNWCHDAQGGYFLLRFSEAEEVHVLQEGDFSL